MKNFTKILLLILLLTSAFSCKDDDDCCTPLLCGVENPAENLPWLKSMIEYWKVNSTIYSYMYVLEGKYLGQTVFIASNCCPFCSSIPLIYNCEGDSIDYKNLVNITEQKVIWKPLDSLCNF